MSSDVYRIDIHVGLVAPDESISRRFFVSTLRAVPLTLSATNSQLQLRVEDSPWDSDARLPQFEKQITVSIPPALLQQDSEADLVISSDQAPQHVLRIPLKISKMQE